MKATKFSKTLFLAVAMGVASTTLGATDETGNNLPVPAPAPAVPASNIYKVNYVTPMAQVEKLVKAGITEDVIRAYVASYPYPFNLTSDNIIHLQSIGVSGAVLAEMLNHDKTLRDGALALQAQVPPPAAYGQPQPGQDQGAYPMNPQPAAGYDTGTPDYYNDLAGYGNWSYDDGYGWAWQPYPWLGYDYYPWGVLGYGGWSYWPNRGWFWYPNSRFHNFSRGGVIAGNRFNGGFGRGLVANRSFVAGRSFAGVRGGFSPSVRSVGGGARSLGGGGGGGARAGGFSGGGHGGGGGGHR